jgi:hypothetical protein
MPLAADRCSITGRTPPAVNHSSTVPQYVPGSVQRRAQFAAYRLEHTHSRPATSVAPRKVSCGFQPGGLTSCRARIPTVATRTGSVVILILVEGSRRIGFEGVQRREPRNRGRHSAGAGRWPLQFAGEPFTARATAPFLNETNLSWQRLTDRNYPFTVERHEPRGLPHLTRLAPSQRSVTRSQFNSRTCPRVAPTFHHIDA